MPERTLGCTCADVISERCNRCSGLANALGPAIWAASGNAVFAWAAGIAALSTLCALIGMRLPGAAPSVVQVPEAAG